MKKRRQPSLRFAQVYLVLLALAALLGDFLASNHPETQNLERHFAPPTRIRFRDAQGGFHWRPFVYGQRLTDPIETLYKEDLSDIREIRFFVRGYEYRLFGLFPSSIHLIGCEADRGLYPWGTDELGRDVLARVLAGSRTSMLVILVGLLFYTALGAGIGMLAAVLGRRCDAVLMRLSEFVLALPALYLILALRALLPPQTPYWQAILMITGTIAAVTWPPMARGVRGLIYQLQETGYVEAARSLGCSKRWILRHHMLPSILPFITQQALIAAPTFILGEIVLSFLDVGVSSAGSSWGRMLKNLRDPRLLTDFWWNLAPLFLAFLTLLALNLWCSRWRWRGLTRSVL
ncbi:MAG: ABC transporter permease [Acidobacteriota bacterium]